jgi:hypothetical protein
VTVFLYHLVITAVIAVATCIVVRWVLPTLLRMALGLLLDCVLWIGAILLLPEYWLSSARRRGTGCPPYVAYEYASAVTGICRVVHLLLRRGLRGLAVAAHAAPLPLVAVVAGGLYVAGLMR